MNVNIFKSNWYRPVCIVLDVFAVVLWIYFFVIFYDQSSAWTNAWWIFYGVDKYFQSLPGLQSILQQKKLNLKHLSDIYFLSTFALTI